MKIVTKSICSLAAAAAAVSVPAWAGDRALHHVWTIQEDPTLRGERTLAREDYVLKQRLLPTGLAALSSDLQEFGLTAGSQLVEVRSPGALVFCDPVPRAQKLVGHSQPCLVDADSDGRFEGLFLTSSVTKGILTVAGSRPKAPRAIGPIAYRRLEVVAFELQLFVGVQYRGNANAAGNHVFQINYGSDASIGSLTSRFVVGKATFPATRTAFGAQFDLLSQTPDGIQVRVSRTIPTQPFGVVKTTTYTIY
ncbi:hypothetical protein [Sphingobium sp. ZW T5_29]|uniref:hypothetical protein n=1 Tax=Sphingobium sp. ZW T5_29 TaxID=3378077 RepID=UPI0038551D57